MKILQLVQEKLLLNYGIGLHEHPINWKILRAYIDFGASAVSCSVYFFNETKTFQDYTNSTCICAAQIGVAILFILFTLNIQQCFSYINEAENIIDSSKLISFNSTVIRVDTL